ncbi:MAG: c-type cytochrome domain-containing protein [Bacteroidota bacterium]
MKIVSSICLFILLSCTVTVAQTISYSKDVYPLIKSKCLKCHEKDDENPNNFAMDNVALIRSSGKTKDMIIPGDGANSYIIAKLLPKPPKGAQMPIFSKKKLTEDEVDLIKRWIDQGAKDN